MNSLKKGQCCKDLKLTKIATKAERLVFPFPKSFTGLHVLRICFERNWILVLRDFVLNFSHRLSSVTGNSEGGERASLLETSDLLGPLS